MNTNVNRTVVGGFLHYSNFIKMAKRTLKECQIYIINGSKKAVSDWNKICEENPEIIKRGYVVKNNKLYHVTVGKDYRLGNRRSFTRITLQLFKDFN